MVINFIFGSVEETLSFGRIFEKVGNGVVLGTLEGCGVEVEMRM